ncbi:hypothetical protein YC2023_044888 [Brassica napus]
MESSEDLQGSLPPKDFRSFCRILVAPSSPEDGVDMNKALATNASRLLISRRGPKSVVVFFVISSDVLIHQVISSIAYQQISWRRDLRSLAVMTL